MLHRATIEKQRDELQHHIVWTLGLGQKGWDALLDTERQIRVQRKRKNMSERRGKKRYNFGLYLLSLVLWVWVYSLLLPTASNSSTTDQFTTCRLHRVAVLIRNPGAHQTRDVLCIYYGSKNTVETAIIEYSPNHRCEVEYQCLMNPSPTKKAIEEIINRYRENG